MRPDRAFAMVRGIGVSQFAMNCRTTLPICKSIHEVATATIVNTTALNLREFLASFGVSVRLIQRMMPSTIPAPRVVTITLLCRSIPELHRWSIIIETKSATTNASPAYSIAGGFGGRRGFSSMRSILQRQEGKSGVRIYEQPNGIGLRSGCSPHQGERFAVRDIPERSKRIASSSPT